MFGCCAGSLGRWRSYVTVATLIRYFDYDYVRYLIAIELTPGGSSTGHIYTQTTHRIQRTERTLQLKN
jgi:hypothetical protein